jgi:hypothetical protein
VSARPTIAVVAPCRESARALRERVEPLASTGVGRLRAGSYAVVVLDASHTTLEAVLRAVEEWLIERRLARTRLFFGGSEFRITAPPAFVAA